MPAYSVTSKIILRDSRGFPTGAYAYTVTSDAGKLYEVHSPSYVDDAWEVASLAKRADGGRAWRWLPDVTKGIARDVLQAVQAHIETVNRETAQALTNMTSIKVQPVNAETFPAMTARACFMACAVTSAKTMARQLEEGATFKTACRAFNELNVDKSFMLTFVGTYVQTIERMHPRGVCVSFDEKTREHVVTNDKTKTHARLIGVGLVA